MALAAVFMAATVSSTVGFAFSAFAAGLLFQIMSDKVAAVEIMLVSSIAVQIYSVSLLRHHIMLSRIKWYLLGGILADAELVEMELAVGSRLGEEIQRIKGAAIHGAEIVRGLTSYAGMDEANLVERFTPCYRHVLGE